jgi:surfactin synthase thioesterase subunit
VLFGHSFGAVIAYEIARRLTEDHDWPPAHLVVSGSLDPTAPVGDRSAGLADDEFVARVEELSGYSHPALADPELREVLLPVLRYDVQQHEVFRRDGVPPLPVPITGVRGASDALVSKADCAGWATVTSAAFELVELPGGHMYLTEDPAGLLRLFGDVVAADRTRVSA